MAPTEFFCRRYLKNPETRYITAGGGGGEINATVDKRKYPIRLREDSKWRCLLKIPEKQAAAVNV